MRFKLIVALVNPDITSDVVDSAQKAGATGNVIIPARGSGIKQAKLFGISVADKTDVILFIVEEHIVQKVLQAMNKDCRLDDPGNGIAIVLAIDKVVGLQKQIEKIKQRLKEEPL
jgi:nitrogen regulatory protein P-II 1